jgi:hypothetical protein
MRHTTFLVLCVSVFSVMFLEKPKVKAEEILEVESYGRSPKRPKNYKREFDQLEAEITEGPISPETEERIKILLSREPSIAEVQEVALHYAAIPSAAEFRRFRTQARLRNILPTISSDYDTNRQRFSSLGNGFQTTSTTPIFPATSPTGTYSNQDVQNNWDNAHSGYNTRGLQAGTQWNLQRLIYDDEITDILSEQRRFATIRSDYMDQVHSAYFERRKKQVISIVNPPKTQAEEILANLEIDELTAKLDSLTGGQFSRILLAKQFKPKEL